MVADNTNSIAVEVIIAKEYIIDVIDSLRGSRPSVISV